MTIEQAIEITQGLLRGERGEVFDPQNDGDAVAIEAITTILCFAQLRVDRAPAMTMQHQQDTPTRKNQSH